ncbi:MAG: tetratricopeptide repeat protein [Pseudomonadota bacterium]
MSWKIIIAGMAMCAAGAAPAAAQSLQIPAVLAEKTDICFGDGQPDQIIEACLDILLSEEVTKEDKSQAFHQRAMAYIAIGDLDNAIYDFNAAMALTPNNAEVLNDRGNAYAQNGDLAAAVADHSRAIEIEPDIAKFYNNRAVDYMDLERVEQALLDLDNAVDLDPDYGAAYRNRSRVRCSLNLLIASLDDKLAAIRLGSVDVGALQEDMTRSGDYAGPINGLLDGQTERSLRAWMLETCRADPDSDQEQL